ncbi:hypothetical protein L218DRAFT_879821, partial [Marasmius fiardii PR-910]
EEDKWPPQILSLADSAVSSTHAEGSYSSYSAGLLWFTQFCDKFNISEADRMPASKTLIAAFISYYIGTKSGDTVKVWLAGLWL